MWVKVNGKNVETRAETISAIQKECCPQAYKPVCVFNGFQTSKNGKVTEGSEIVFIEKGKMPSREVFEAMMNARNTPRVYKKIKEGRVAIVGLGGLGSNIALALARTGVGHLHLIDFDVVEPTNLNRQQYNMSHLGMYKTEAMKDEITKINPFIHVKIDTVRVSRDKVQDLFLEDEIICEALDKPSAKAMLINALLEYFPEKNIVAASGLAGYDSSNTIKTRKSMGKLYLCGDEVNGVEAGKGLMAPRVLVCAGHEANMILRLLLNETTV